MTQYTERDMLAHQLNRQKQWKDVMRDKMQALEAEVEMWKATANAVVDFEKVELRKERDDLRSQVDSLNVGFNNCQKERDALQAQLAAAQLVAQGQLDMWVKDGKLIKELRAQLAVAQPERAPLIPCRCFDEVSKRLCMDKNKCVRIEAHGIKQGGQQ